MKKVIKKTISIFLIAVMLFTEFSPYAVYALDGMPDANKGEVYNPETGKGGTSATVQANSYTSGEYGEGDVEVQKIVSQVPGELGKYKVEFKIRGEEVSKTTVTTKPVYAVVVLDRSGSMNDADGKWSSATQGAKDFATTLLANVPTAQIALVGFAGDSDCFWGICVGKYDDAELLRGFDNSNFNNVNFGSPNGGTNIEAGLRVARQELDKITGDVFKYVVVIGDGAPTFYYNSDGYTAGDGNGFDEDAEQAAYDEANLIKIDETTNKADPNVKIYAIGYEVAENSDAETTLKNIASPNETVDGELKKYYFNADANAVGKALTDIAESITVNNYAGTNATVTDRLGDGFTLTSGSATLKVDTITEEWTSMGSFTMTIDGDLEAGWYDTNQGFTLTYTDAHGNPQTITCNINPQVYWEPNEYAYRIEYYYDNKIDDNKTVNGTAIKDAQITVTDEMINNNLKTGYVYKTISTNPITISNTGENVIKVYYERITYNYVVNHYVEDASVEGGYRLQETDSDNKIKYQDTARYTPNTYNGYQYVAGSTTYNQDDLVVEDNNLVINLYYDKNTYSYVVRHNLEKKDGTGYTLTDSETLNAKYQEEAKYQPKNYNGYTFSKAENNQIDYIIEDDQMVINLYYDLIDYKYTVEYYQQDLGSNNYTKVEDDTYTASAYYDDEATANSKKYEGFTYVNTEYTNNNVVIQSNKVVDNNLVIKVYYNRNTYNYTVEYYTKDLGSNNYTKVEDDTYTASAYYNQEVNANSKTYPGFTHEKTEYTNNGTVITSKKVVDNNLVIKVYYDRNTYNYVVEHYKQDLGANTFTKANTDTYTNKEYGSKVVYVPRNYVGFTYDSGKSINIDKETLVEDGLVIKLYYVRNTYSYTVEHYQENLDGETYTQTSDVDVYTNVEFGSDATFETNDYAGFVYNESLTTPKVRVVPANDSLVIRLYYDRAVCDYTVNYYYDGVKDAEKTDTFKEVFGKEVSTYTDKFIDGYHFVRDTAPITITTDSSQNVIDVYYEKNLYTYTVEYYAKDLDSNNYSKVDTYTRSEYHGETVTPDSKTYPGFTHEKTEYTNNGNVITSKKVVDNNLVIKVYYDRNTYDYVVEHYKQDLGKDTFTKANTDTYTNKEYGSKVVYVPRNYDGFTYDSEKSINIDVETLVEDGLVIKLYYVRNSYNYTVEYYTKDLDSNNYSKVEDDTYTASAYYEQEVNADSKTYPGFTHEKTEYTNNGNVITSKKVVDNNLVIKVYYDRNTYDYVVEHYKQDLGANTFTKANTDTYTNKEYGSKVVYVPRNYDGFTYDSEKSINIDVETLVEDGLVIKLYYVRNSYNYTVEYYTKDLDSNNYSKVEDDTYAASAYYNQEVNANSKTYPGFTHEKTEYTNNGTVITSKKVVDNNLVIKVYYVRNTYDYVVEHYLEDLGKDTFTKQDTDTYTNKEYGSLVVYETNVYTGFTYDSEKSINIDVETLVEDGLVIKLYYVRNTYQYVVEHYLENDLDDNFTLQSDDTETFEAKYNELGVYTSNEYANYTFDDSLTEPEDLTINDDTLTIKLYYLKNKSNVTVHYVIKDVDTGEYIPFSVYGNDGEGNNTEDFAGLELEDLILNGKIDTEFTINGRNPNEYKFIGLYEGNLLDGIEEVEVSCNEDQSYTDNYREEDLEFTYVYQAPAGNIPPITGIENNLPSYLGYILIGVLTLLTGTYIRYIKREEENA